MRLNETVRFRIRRSPSEGVPSDGYQEYEVPFTRGMSVMDGLDYIYEHLDGSLAYYDHAACNQGICRHCLARINGQNGLLCQTLVTEDTTVEPLPMQDVERDLVTKWRRDG